MLAKLIPIKEGVPPYRISKDVIVVGRKRGLCDLVIDHPSISKIHCIVARTDGLLFIRDLGSTNGTKVNGQKVLRGAILPGDELAFAKVKFKVFMGPDDPNDQELDEKTEFNGASVAGEDHGEFRFFDENEDDEFQLIEDDD